MLKLVLRMNEPDRRAVNLAVARLIRYGKVEHNHDAVRAQKPQAVEQAAAAV